MQSVTKRQLQLIDSWQDGFPLAPEPYDVIAQRLNAIARDIIQDLLELRRLGVLTRIGAAVRPNSAGASTLAAMAVSETRLEQVARMVNAEPGVNHNYEREHAINLWFVVTGQDRAAVQNALDRIARRTDLAVLDLPLAKSYHINLGFPVSDASLAERGEHRSFGPEHVPREVSLAELDLLGALEDGLALDPHPYRELARLLGWPEQKVLACLRALIEDRIISRFGLIVSHRELGFKSNAMVVWNVADAEVDKVGEMFARQPFVTLCYRRPRRPSRWPYNLFCMIHGRQRSTVLEQVEQLKSLTKHQFDTATLFSRRRFKQRGARLTAA